MILKRILASLELEYYKEIVVCIFKELALVELHDARALTDPHDFNFPDGLCFVGAQGQFENRFPFFLEVFYSEDNSANSNSYDIILSTKLFPIQHNVQSALE